MVIAIIKVNDDSNFNEDGPLISSGFRNLLVRRNGIPRKEAVIVSKAQRKDWTGIKWGIYKL